MLKNLSKKAKYFWLGTLSIMLSLFLLLGILLTLPGMGIQSLKFIESVEKQINRSYPKGKYVINGQSATFGAIINSSIRTSYQASILSGLNSYANPKTTESVRQSYLAFANAWFDKTWQPVINAKKNIDLNDVGLNLIQFDRSSAQTFHSVGYVNNGLAWMFSNQGIKEIFSKNIYQSSLKRQTILDQKTYSKMIQATEPGVGGVQVLRSIGSHVVNNKVWFVNLQLKNLAYAMQAIPTHNIFLKKVTPEEIMTPITTSDLYHPNFTAAIHLTRAGVVFMLMWPFILATITPVMVLIIIWNKKK